MSADIRMVRWADRDRDEFARLTLALARVRDAVRRGGSDLVAPPPQGPEDPSDPDRARALLAQDGARDAAAAANADLFANPAWHAMLTLFVAQDDGGRVSAGALKAGCGVLPVPAARWLSMLEQRGLIALSGATDDDPVTLTGEGAAFLARCLRAI